MRWLRFDLGGQVVSRPMPEAASAHQHVALPHVAHQTRECINAGSLGSVPLKRADVPA
ncbi:MAG: hypothetical protein J2P48_09275 [Alphaproteobacteria bacterium]|nr:hypothetical protein [Alphaproteobacteria bacterium]